MSSGSDRERGRLRGLVPVLLLALCAGAAAFVAAQDAGSPSKQVPAESPALAVPVGPRPGAFPPSDELKNPLADDPEVELHGRELFLAFNCAGCHGTHAGGGMGPSLRDERWIYGSSDAHIFASIAEGRANGMPAWGTLLPATEIWKLVAYIRSLRTPQEPDPPR